MAFNLPFVLTAASVGLSAGFIIHYFTKRNEEIFVTAEYIYVYGAIDKVAIEAGYLNKKRRRKVAQAFKHKRKEFINVHLKQ